jgi:hypothetical protein
VIEDLVADLPRVFAVEILPVAENLKLMRCGIEALGTVPACVAYIKKKLDGVAAKAEEIPTKVIVPLSVAMKTLASMVEAVGDTKDTTTSEIENLAKRLDKMAAANDKFPQMVSTVLEPALGSLNSMADAVEEMKRATGEDMTKIKDELKAVTAALGSCLGVSRSHLDPASTYWNHLEVK